MHVPSLIASAAAALLLAACGGGHEPAAEAPAGPAAAPTATSSAAVLQLRHALAASARPATAAAAAATSEQAAEQLFAYAQSSVFASYFPGNPATQSLPPFRYRYYPATGVYLGVVVTAGQGYALDGVYVMGGPFGSSPVYVGPLTQFITPVDPNPGPGANNGCHDLALLEATGTHIELALQYSGSSTGNVAIDWRVTGPKTFEGQAAVESLIKTTGSIASEAGEGVLDIEARSYARRTGDAEVTQYGEDTLTKVSGGGFQMTTSAHSVDTPPAADRRYGLAVGQSLTASVTATTTTTTTGLPGAPATPTTSTDTSTTTIRFVGREALTVPAGHYATCRYETTFADDPGTVLTTWVIDGKGIPVKTVTATAESTEVQQATSVRLNGQPL